MSHDPFESCVPAQSRSLQNPWLQMLARHFAHLETGRLTVVLPDGGSLILGETGPHKGKGGPQACLQLSSYKPLSKLFLKGELAFAQSYLEGEWDSPDVTALFDLVLMNEEQLGGKIMGRWLSRTLYRLRHLLNRNSKSGSRRNIAYHYDLGNDFFQQWLDPSMTYSSALFATGQESLEEAQHAKYHAIADLLDLKPTDHVLEIGCGWGGFSTVAARDYGARIHGLTLSQEQLAYAENRYQAAGLAERATASYTDYRDSEGEYDKIASIEMFEAVGEDHWDSYFQTVFNRLKPGGIAVLQVITIENKRFAAYRKSTDFIQRYIFPGGFLPSPRALEDSVQRNGLNLAESHFFGDSYARTCALWQKHFQHAWPDIAPLGYDAPFKRMWEYYLSYCEAGFKAGTINVGFFKITKPA